MVNESSEEEKGEKKEEYSDPPHALLFDAHELKLWSFYRAIIVEFVATLLFLYVTIATVIGDARMNKVAPCNGVGVLGIAWSFGGMIFVLVYCTAGISGGHINPAVTFAFLIARRVSIPRAVLYIIAQCGGAICGVGLVKCFQGNFYMSGGGGANHVAEGYTIFTGLAVEVMGTFVLVYIIFSSVDPKRRARDTHVPVLVPLPIGFAIFTIHLAVIPITGTGINPARSFATAVMYNQTKTWDDHWIFWVGPLVGAATAAGYHQYVLRGGAFKAFESFHNNHIGLYSKISCKE